MMVWRRCPFRVSCSHCQDVSSSRLRSSLQSKEPVEDGVGESRVAENFTPALEHSQRLRKVRISLRHDVVSVFVASETTVIILSNGHRSVTPPCVGSSRLGTRSGVAGPLPGHSDHASARTSAAFRAGRARSCPRPRLGRFLEIHPESLERPPQRMLNQCRRAT